MTHIPTNAGDVTFMDVHSDISEGALQDKSDTASRVTKRKSPDDIVFHVPRTCMERVIRDILFMQSGGQEFRVTNEASELLHAQAEQYMTNYFSCAAVVAANGDRETILPSDLKVVSFIRKTK